VTSSWFFLSTLHGVSFVVTGLIHCCMGYDNGQAVYSGTDVAAGFPFLRVLHRQLCSFHETQKPPAQNTSDFFFMFC